MFVISKRGNALFQVVAMLVAVALALWAVGAHATVEAANLTSVSNTLSDSDPGFVSNHVFRFTIPTGSAGLAAGESVTTTFPLGFNISTSSVDYSDVDVLVNGAHLTLDHTPAGATWGATTSDQNLVITSGTGTLSADDEVVIYVGSNATTGAAGNQEQVTNHGSAGSYEFTIETPVDSGQTRVALIDDVVVTANVDTSFQFTVNGFSVTGTDANGTSTTGTSTATEIGYATLSAGSIETIAQRLNVSTNAIGGFVVTVEQDGNLRSTTGADIDPFANGQYVNSPVNWTSPTSTITLEYTWGHWGLTSTDDINSGEFQACGDAATGGCWIAASTTPREVFSHTGPADGLTDDVGSSTVAYQVEITSLQEAADDYQTTLTYIATPTF